MMGLYFSETMPTSFSEVSKCDVELFKEFFHAMLVQRSVFRAVGI